MGDASMSFIDDDVVFATNNGGTELLRFKPTGEIYVQGRWTSNDIDVVNGIRQFLIAAELIKGNEDGSPRERN